MSEPQGINGIGIAAAAIGSLFLWSGLKGASVTETLRALLKGEEPSGTNVHPIVQEQYAEETGSAVADTGIGIVGATDLVKIASRKIGQPYGFGAGHGIANPCTSKKSDCSSFVSCALQEAGLMRKGPALTTWGLAKIGVGVPYKDRSIGDLIVWNGGTGGGHVGIIASVEGNGGKMIHNPCTNCGGVQIGKYPYGSRTAATAIVRRVNR